MIASGYLWKRAQRLLGVQADLTCWIAREMEREDTIDYVRRLYRAGLIHKTTDGHVFASRPAFRLVQIVGEVV